MQNVACVENSGHSSDLIKDTFKVKCRFMDGIFVYSF